MLGLMVVLALSLSAFYAYKTRSKIWRHGKANIYWDEPLVRPSEGQDVQDWVRFINFRLHIIYSKSTKTCGLCLFLLLRPDKDTRATRVFTISCLLLSSSRMYKVQGRYLYGKHIVKFLISHPQCPLGFTDNTGCC